MTVVQPLGPDGIFQITDSRKLMYTLRIIISSDQTDMERTDREIQARAMIQDNPFLINVYCHGALLLQHKYYNLIVMPYLEMTGDIYERVTTYNEDRVLEFGADVTQALDACHRNGIIHRGVKPDNIFVSDWFSSRENGQYLQSKKWPLFILGDFEAANGTTGSVFTPPEMLQGPAPRESSDNYSLGAALYWCANRNQDHPNAAASESRFTKKPADASEELWSIICKATQTDPEKRYQTAHELQNALLSLRDRRRLADMENERRQAERDLSIDSLYQEIGNLKAELGQSIRTVGDVREENRRLNDELAASKSKADRLAEQLQTVVLQQRVPAPVPYVETLPQTPRPTYSRQAEVNPPKKRIKRMVAAVAIVGIVCLILISYLFFRP